MQLLSSLPTLLVLGTLAMQAVDAASVSQRTTEDIAVRSNSGKKHAQHAPPHKHPKKKKKHPKHPKHPKKHPHPHPHPHPTGTQSAAPTNTATQTPSPPAPTPPAPARITCSNVSGEGEVVMMNVAYDTYTAPPPPRKRGEPPSYPYPYLVFSDNNLVSVPPNQDRRYVNVEVFRCLSEYMGYDPYNNNIGRRRRALLEQEHTDALVRREPVPQVYGLVRLKDNPDTCVVAASPGSLPSMTSFTTAPCSYIDDATQVPQFFRFSYSAGGSFAQYLGDRFASTQDASGRHYNMVASSTDSNGEVLQSEVNPTPTYDDASFYFAPQPTPT